MTVYTTAYVWPDEQGTWNVSLRTKRGQIAHTHGPMSKRDASNVAASLVTGVPEYLTHSPHSPVKITKTTTGDHPA